MAKRMVPVKDKERVCVFEVRITTYGPARESKTRLLRFLGQALYNTFGAKVEIDGVPVKEIEEHFRPSSIE